MKINALAAVIIAAGILMTGCGKAETKEKAQPEKTAETVSEAEESRPEGSFEKLPDDALEAFNKMTAELKDIFPDIKGKLMYGYTGEALVETDGGEKDCYIFDYYTYKKKIYTKIATVAMDKENSIVYLLNEDNGTYSEAESEKSEEQQWCETATPALAVASDTEISE